MAANHAHQNRPLIAAIQERGLVSADALVLLVALGFEDEVAEALTSGPPLLAHHDRPTTRVADRPRRVARDRSHRPAGGLP